MKQGIKPKIRGVRPSDGDFIAQVYNQYLGQGSLDLEEKKGAYFEAAIEQLGSREGIWILEIEDQAAGWGQIKKYSPRLGYQYTAETSVYLEQSFRRKGYGSHMKRFLIEEAKTLNYKHLVAKILAQNEASIQYNLKFGYEIVGTQRSVGYVNGKWIDVVIMQLVLNG